MEEKKRKKIIAEDNVDYWNIWVVVDDTRTQQQSRLEWLARGKSWTIIDRSLRQPNQLGAYHQPEKSLQKEHDQFSE